MTTTTPTPGVTLLRAAELLATHLANHDLPDPWALTVTTRKRHSEVTVQLPSTTVPGIAANLLAWADTLSAVTVTAWRAPEGDRVHLSITSTLTSPAGSAELGVFSGADYDPVRFADLTPGQRRSVSLADLRSWAAAEPATTTSPALRTPGTSR